MLSHNDLKKGTRFIINDQPYEVLESSFNFKGRGSSSCQTKIRNLITGNVIAKTFHPGENFDQAEIEKVKVKFLYHHRDEFYFSEEKDQTKRFQLAKEIIGQSFIFLKPNEIIEGIKFQDEIINVSLPVKVELKVIEAPPGIKGDRAQGGTKIIKLETGAEINAPLFIKQGDVVEVNTEKKEYSRRIDN
jgi:elongation factor P